MEGLFKSGTQNKKLNVKEAAAIAPKQHLKNHVNVVLLFTAANWSKFYENFPKPLVHFKVSNGVWEKNSS